MIYKIIQAGNYLQVKSKSSQGVETDANAVRQKAQRSRDHKKSLIAQGLMTTEELKGVWGSQPQAYVKRSDNLSRVRNRLKLLAHANINSYSKFITLTTQKVHTLKEFQGFIRLWLKQLKRDLKVDLKYIGVYEYQERGAPHVHLIFFNQQFINWSKGLKHWRSIIGGIGSLQVKRCDPNKHINYLLFYLHEPCIKEIGAKSVIRSIGLEEPKVYKDNMPPHLNNLFLKVEYSRIMGSSQSGSTYENIYGYLTKSKDDNSFTFDECKKFLFVSLTRINAFENKKGQSPYQHKRGATGGAAPTSA
jgi:hypothetical protein